MGHTVCFCAGELVIELLARLNDPRAKLVITHHAGDEGLDYLHQLQEMATAQNVDLRYVADMVGDMRQELADGRKIYTLWDACPHADFVTYPSLYEGFGNALIETVCFRKPALVNRYSVYVDDIVPCGFQFVEIDGAITDEAVTAVRDLLTHLDTNCTNFHESRITSQEVIMKAMQLRAPKPVSDDPLVLTDTAVPNPAPGQIRLKVSVCGVCHTDLHTVEGELELPRLPLIPGHEIVGVVEALGKGVTRHQVGDRVGVAWVNWTCGKCDYCRRGLENLCPQARFTGLHADGGYAEYVVVDENFAYPLPPVFADVHAAPLLCAGIVGYRSLRLSGIQPGERLGLYGFGASAHLVIQVARHWDCEVYVFTRSPAHREHARELGAVWRGGAEDMPPELLDASVTFAPAGWIIPQALRHLRPGGTVAINAIHMSPIPEIPYHLIYGERVVRSVANFTRYDAEAFLRLAGEIPIRTDVETFPLAEANDALRQMKASQIQGAAVLEIL